MTGISKSLKSAFGMTSPEDSVPSDRQEAYESFLSGVAIQGLLLITGILAARMLGEDGRGEQALIWIVALTTVQVGMLGLPLALTYEVAKGKATMKQLLGHFRSIALVQIGVVVVVYAAVMALAFIDRVPWSAALVTIAALPAMIWQAYGLALIQGRHHFRALHVLRILPSALYAIGLGIAFFLYDGSVFVVMSTWTIAYVITAAVTQIYLHFMDQNDVDEDLLLPGRGEMVRFGAVGFLGASSPMETFRVDQLAVGVILTTGDLALYTTALAFCNLPRFLTQSLGLIAYAKIAAVHLSNLRKRMLVRYSLFGVGGAFAVSLPLALLAAPLITLTFGPDFSGATLVTQILLGATVILCARRMLSDCLRGVGLPGAGSVSEVASLISLVPAIILLVPPLGLEGFALAMVVSNLVGLIVLFFYLFRHWNSPALSDTTRLEQEGA